MRIYNDLIFSETVTNTTSSSYFTIKHIYGFAVQVVWDVNTPAAKNFTDANITAATDSITITGHTLNTGLVGQFTSSGTLPSALALATDYYIIKIDDNTIKVAATLADALAGVAIDIAADGSGTHTFTATAIAGGVGKIQVTNDEAEDPTVTPTWSDLSGSQAVSADGSYMFNYDAVHAAYMRFTQVLTAGQVVVRARVNAKGF